MSKSLGGILMYSISLPYKSVFRISEKSKGVKLQGAQMGQKFIYRRIWGPRNLPHLGFSEILKTLL